LYLFTDRGYSNTPNHLNQYGTKSKKRKFSNDDEELVHLDIKGETFNILVEEAKAQKRQSGEEFMLKLMCARSENELKRLKSDNAALRMKIVSLTSEINKKMGVQEMLNCEVRQRQTLQDENMTLKQNEHEAKKKNELLLQDNIRLQKETKDLSKENSFKCRCIICYNSFSECAFAAIPCYHTLCETCSIKYPQCPVCGNGNCKFIKIIFI
jgi:predicted RNase H-like nuclease (RuvC/YqgF family)